MMILIIVVIVTLLVLWIKVSEITQSLINIAAVIDKQLLEYDKRINIHTIEIGDIEEKLES